MNRSENNVTRNHQKMRSSFHGMLFLAMACLMLMPVWQPLYGQDEGTPIEISGVVVDQGGEPLPGVNVVIKGTYRGTITDINGRFSIAAKTGDVLTVSYIGFTTQEIPVTGQATLNLTLQEDIAQLEEVVIVGYGEVKRVNLLGSVESISSSEIEDIPAVSMTNLLDGRMAGVSVAPAQPTGNPGAATRVRIRAETTFGRSGEGAKDPAPLYIVDGFKVTQDEFDVLDPSEIESYSVLKDASAAVYGSKGANGVVLVKTKRGREGKISISYSGSVGISDATMQTEMLNAYDHARAINALNDSDDMVFPTELEAMKDQDFNWLNEAWKRSLVTRHTFNFSGGTERIKYYAGGSYNYTDGNFPDLGVGKYSYRLGLDAGIIEGMTISATIALDNKDFKRPYISGAGNNTLEDLFQELLQAPKWTPAYIDGYPVANNLSFNPLYLFETQSYKRSVDKGNTLNIRLSYDIPVIEGLSTSASFSRRENHSYGKDYLIPYTLYEFKPLEDFKYILGNEILKPVTVQNKNRISESYNHGQNYQLNLSLNYSRVFGRHSVSSFFTYEQSEGQGYYFLARASNIETYGLENQDAFQTKETDGRMNESGDLGAVFRLNYSFADKYLIESTLRYETTTLFAPGERAGLFPSASIGWIVSEEDFFRQNVNFMDFFKIRYSAGLMGYSSVSPYEYNLQYSLANNRYLFGGDNPIGGLGIGGKTDVVSSGVTWEKSFMQNLGIDMKFFESKLGITADGFYTYQYDILTQRTVEFPETAGLGQMPGENLGRLKAWGYDMSINYRGRIRNDIFWDIGGIFSYATNRILEQPTQLSPEDFRYPIGQSTTAEGREEGFLYSGIIRTQDQLDALNEEWIEKWGHGYEIEGSPAGLGAMIFEDIGRPGNVGIGEPRTVFEPDGVINEFDKQYVERVGDKFTWKHLLPTNISLGLKWRDLRVSMLWSMAYGISNQAVDKLARTVPDADDNSPAFWSDFWTPENPNAKYPSPYYGSSNRWVSTFWMEDIVQLRLKNLNISYSIPQKATLKWGIKELRIFFAGTNLWSPITTFDYKEDAIARYNTYPLLRTFSFGLNLKI